MKGELAARGPNIMAGYWKNEAATREVLKDGWYLTGDQAYVDPDGFYYVVGSKGQSAEGRGAPDQPQGN